ncbi:MAG TPA: ATP-binding protein [Vicinamibacterales bacterium]|nr:ATP-binding protein [Vicinamibacterales bacterium]
MAKAPTPGNTTAAVRRSVVGRRARHTADESARPNQRRADGSDRLKQLNEQLTRIGEAKARYFANISHELRTPLALILGPIEKHLRETPGMDGALRRDLEVVLRNARTALRHVNDLLDVAKIEAGRVAVDYVAVDAAALVRTVSRHFSALAEEQRCTFTVDAPAQLPVETDADKLQSILLNLVSNAFKYTPQGGRVRVTLRDAGQRFQLEVADSGPGIPSAKRKTVFDRFERLEGEGAQQPTGTGLGLSIVKDFAVLLGGGVGIGDAPESGALFVVDLPATAPPGTEVAPAPADDERAAAAEAEVVVALLRQSNEPVSQPEVTAGTAGRVLIVEDSQDMNRFIASCLSRDGFTVIEAFDGMQGYEKATADHPDLVLTDIVMPRMPGDELIRRLRQRSDFSSTPILVLGAKSGEQFGDRLKAGDVQDYLDKPFSVDELRVRVRALIRDKKASEQSGTPMRDAATSARTAISSVIASFPAASVQMAFQTVALVAQNLTGASYAAVAIGGDVERPLDVWAVTGLSADQMATAGRHPGPVGLLGLVGSEHRTTVVRAPAPHHPETRSVLGVPIRCDGHPVGSVYVASKRGGAEFTDSDQRAVDMLAARAGAALQAARQHAGGASVGAWLQSLIDQMPGGVQLMDRHGHVTLSNRWLRSLAKAGPPVVDRYGNAITIDFREPTGDQVEPDNLPLVSALAGQQITRRRELFARRHDDTLVPLHVSATPIFTSDGTCAGAAMVIREITLLREAGRVHNWAAIATAERRQPLGIRPPRQPLVGTPSVDNSGAKSTARAVPRRRV